MTTKYYICPHSKICDRVSWAVHCIPHLPDKEDKCSTQGVYCTIIGSRLYDSDESVKCVPSAPAIEIANEILNGV